MEPQPISLDFNYSLGEDLLEVKNVFVSYDQNPILRDLSFNVKNIQRAGCQQGQVEAILAPSGMGKSQTFRCISGLKKPDSGEVLLTKGCQPVKVGMVGVVAQDYPLFNHLTVQDNIVLAAKLREKDPKATEDAMALLEKFGLTDKKHNYPHELSGGQRQRVAIIQQMVCDGNFLLMDEPFSGLDPLAKQIVENLITDVAKLDDLTTVIITTHDIKSAIAVADTIRLLGRERDASGQIIPGANIRFEYDLMKMGLSWHPNVHELPQFNELEKEIIGRFKEL